jgi:putative hydrolase of the HAD superfamily
MSSKVLRKLARRPVFIFDLFHTLSTLHHAGIEGPNLFELLGASREQVNDALFSDSEARLKGYISEPPEVIADIAARCGVSLSSAQCAEYAAIRADRFSASLREVAPETLATLDCLRRSGKRLALISNADVIEAFGWDSCPLAERFEVAIISCHVGLAKPEPEIYRLCMDQLAVTADECVFIGDGGSNEFHGARRCGIPTICTTEFIRDIFPGRVSRHTAAADCSVAALSELCAAVEE